MGKQIAVAMTIKDEENFLDFLNSIANIQIFISPAPNKEAFYINCFSKEYNANQKYYIWNKEFKWSLELGKITHDKTGERQNWFFIKDYEAPLIEYSRHNFEDEKMYGRIYWSKNFASPNPLKYDAALFEKWYNKVVRWIRKNGKQKEKGRFLFGCF